MKLDVLSGESFDKAYIKAMVQDHSKDLAEFRQEVKSTGYPPSRTQSNKANRSSANISR